MPCLIKKASRCAKHHTSKTTTFFIFHFQKHKDIKRKSCVFSLVQQWKLYYIYIFFIQKRTDLDRLKRNMNDGKIIFLTSLVIAVTWNILLLFSFWPKIISCFELKNWVFLSTWAIKAPLFLKKRFDHNIWNNEKRKQYKHKQFWHFD